MRVLIVVIVGLFICTSGQPNPNTSSSKSSINKAAANKERGETQKNPPNSDSATIGDQERKGAYDASKDSLYRVYLLFTVIGVCGGLIGLLVLICQTKSVRKAADAAKDSADAALLNAKSIINSERPWLFIEIKTTAEPSIPVGEVPKYMGFSVSFRNWGKTPAEVVSFDQHLDCRENLDDLPSPPEYFLKGRVMVHTRMVPPGQVWCHPSESHFSPESSLVGDQWNEIRNSRQRFIYWGRIQYRDLIEESKTIHELKEVGTIHETCFCYFWSPRLNEFLICGPLGYNKHT